MRLVIDPGVYISALLASNGPPGQLIRRWFGGEVEFVASPTLVDELAEVLARPKFRAWVTADAANAFVALVTSTVVRVPDAATQRGVSPDPGDDYLVALAMGGNIDALVTGDRALRSVRIEGLVILTPVEALGTLDAVDRPSADA